MSRKSPKKQIRKAVRSKSLRSTLGSTYWSVAAGVAGLAVTAYLLVSAMGGRRVLASKARELLDWKKISSFASSHLANGSQRLERSDGEALTH